MSDISVQDMPSRVLAAAGVQSYAPPSLATLHGQLTRLSPAPAETVDTQATREPMPFRGILIGLGIALPFWAASGWAVSRLF